MGEVAVVVFLLGGWTLAPKRNLKFGTVFSFFFLSFFLSSSFLPFRSALSSLSDVVFTGVRQSRVFLRGI